MNKNSQMPVGATGVQRQWPVMVVSCFFIVAGIVGIVYHLPEWRHAPGPMEVGAVTVRLLAIVCGVFMLMGKNWARWLAVIWLAYHVMLSAFHTVGQTVFHLMLLVVFAWVLFRKDAERHFSGV